MDGNTDSLWGHGSCSHTGQSATASAHTWRVDLGAEYFIDHIIIYNRQNERFNIRLNNFKVALLHDGVSDLDRNGNFTSDEVCYEHLGAASLVNTVHCRDASSSQGRYVFVYLLTGVPLTLCEVQVYSDGVVVVVPSK